MCTDLQSRNRTNVALSRAQEGLYILGNASALADKGAWNAVLDELEEQEAIGPAFGLQCARHPDSTSWIVEPHDFDQVAPGGT